MQVAAFDLQFAAGYMTVTPSGMVAGSMQVANDGATVQSVRLML